ncbi:hypothetical protein KCU59_g79, partial [Aureobasidium melanogenum]
MRIEPADHNMLGNSLYHPPREKSELPYNRKVSPATQRRPSTLHEYLLLSSVSLLTTFILLLERRHLRAVSQRNHVLDTSSTISDIPIIVPENLGLNIPNRYA